MTSEPTLNLHYLRQFDIDQLKLAGTRYQPDETRELVSSKYDARNLYDYHRAPNTPYVINRIIWLDYVVQVDVKRHIGYGSRVVRSTVKIGELVVMIDEAGGGNFIHVKTTAHNLHTHLFTLFHLAARLEAQVEI